VVRCAGNRVRHPGEPEFVEARHELLVMLVAEHRVHPSRGIAGTAPAHQRQDQPGEGRVIEIGDGAHRAFYRRRSQRGRYGLR
jgi:hypothetical protein